MGWSEDDFYPGEIIPQGIKYISNAPLTEEDFRWADKVIAKLKCNVLEK